jgi:hypothetical protein
MKGIINFNVVPYFHLTHLQAYMVFYSPHENLTIIVSVLLVTTKLVHAKLGEPKKKLSQPNFFPNLL